MPHFNARSTFEWDSLAVSESYALWVIFSEKSYWLVKTWHDVIFILGTNNWITHNVFPFVSDAVNLSKNVDGAIHKQPKNH